MAKKKAAKHATPIESLKHSQNTRTNIPTREQGVLIADDEAAPKKVLLSPRSIPRSAACLEGQGRAGSEAARSAGGADLHSEERFIRRR